jgi:hypothetical protein
MQIHSPIEQVIAKSTGSSASVLKRGNGETRQNPPDWVVAPRQFCVKGVDHGCPAAEPQG